MVAAVVVAADAVHAAKGSNRKNKGRRRETPAAFEFVGRQIGSEASAGSVVAASIIAAGRAAPIVLEAAAR